MAAAAQHAHQLQLEQQYMASLFVQQQQQHSQEGAQEAAGASAGADEEAAEAW